MLKRRSLWFLGFLLFLLNALPRTGYCDFLLLDAIKEFGEKRFLEPLPARLKAGPVRVHPTLRTQVEYDDNILLEDQDAREDVIWDVMPGVILDLPVDKHRISVGYEADIESFSKGRHHSQNDQNQNFITLANFHFPSWYVNVLERLSETSGRSGTTFTSRIPRIDHQIHPKIGYRWKRAIFEAGFRHTTRDFRRQIDDALDFQMTEWTGVIYYDLFARLKALAEYQVGQIDYDDDYYRNGTFQQTQFGFVGEILPRVVAQFKIGPQFRNYETSSKPNFNSWVGDLKMEYQMRSNLKFETVFSRSVKEATFSGINYFRQHLLEFGAEYRLLSKWTLFSRYKFYRHSYAERATVNDRTGYRRDDHNNVKTGLRYEPLEWLDLELAYTYARRDSNFSTFDYTDNRVTLSSIMVY